MNKEASAVIEQDNDEGHKFVELLEKEGLCYSSDKIEYFMLALKAKQFVILSGGSGTGKTKLAQTYGKYLNECYARKTEYRSVEVTLGKSDVNGGYTLGSKLYGKNYPLTKPKTYPIRIGKLETTAEIELTPRLWFRQNKAIISKEIKRLKDEGNESTEIMIYDPSLHNLSNDHFELVPVGSNWTESRFIVGYYNVLKNEYKDTPSYRLIKKSNDLSEEPFILILDEMNLSHVERYFSDVLSAMESQMPIKLDVPEDHEEKELFIGDNLFIIGTVNVDETTYSFSPKVLDRANVIEFEPMDVQSYIDFNNSDYKFTGNVDYLFDSRSGIEVRNMGSKEIITKLSVDNSGMVKTMIEDLEKIRSILDTINLSFGFRTIDEILRFMYVSFEYTGSKKFDDWERFFDAQIKQKILPKIHGNSSIMESLEKIRDEVCKGHYQSSYEKLDHMISILMNQRYVTFNS